MTVHNFKLSRFYLPVGILIVILIIIEIWVSHSLVTYGEQFKDIESLSQKMASENQILENQIEILSSINAIASASAGLGMEVPKDIKYIH